MQAQAQTIANGQAHHAYYLACVPEPYRILGLRLRPFSLGHYLLLQKFNCAYVQDEVEPRHADLTLGCLVCSMRFAEFIEFIEQKNFLHQVKKWGKRIGVYRFAEKSAMFTAYLQASLREPDYICTQPTDGAEGDWTHNLKTTLVTRLGYTDTEALDMPLTKALSEYYKLAESEGILRLLTPEDIAMAKANDAALAALEELQTAKPEKEDHGATP